MDSALRLPSSLRGGDPEVDYLAVKSNRTYNRSVDRQPSESSKPLNTLMWSRHYLLFKLLWTIKQDFTRFVYTMEMSFKRVQIAIMHQR